MNSWLVKYNPEIRIIRRKKDKKLELLFFYYYSGKAEVCQALVYPVILTQIEGYLDTRQWATQASPPRPTRWLGLNRR
jgi:hypothetical protein